MNPARYETFLAVGAIGASCAWTAAWGLNIAAGGRFAAHLAAAAVVPVLAGAVAAVLLARSGRHRRAAVRHLEALAGLDPRDVHSDVALAKVPPLARNNPFYGPAQAVAHAVRSHLERLREAEHDRTALEVRCRRASAQYEQIRTILAGLPDPVLAVDDYAEVVLANPSAEALFEPDAKAHERAVARLVRCQKLVDLLASAAQRKASGRRTEEIELADAQGQLHYYRATATRLAPAGAEGGEGAAAGAVAVLRDVGDQRALQKRNAEFVSSVSHEMKTPLAGIKAYVELLADGDAEDEQTREEFLQVINGQADRLQRLVENLLNLARIEAGVVSVHKEDRSLNEVLEEALRVVQPAAEGKQITLAADLSPLYLGVLADRDMLLQAAINLLSNAVKYTPASGRVTLRSRLEDDRVRFEVEDTGVGLSEEDCQRIFEKFYRVKKDQEMASGTGLGLPLAKHIVEDVHGGQLSVRSVPGKGSTFIVTLPHAGQMA